MDLRVKKTRNSIINAFLKLRAKKQLEKISIKELADMAVINKATFYLHYKDIYDLSETLENELFENIFKYINHYEAIISNPKLFIKELSDAFISNKSLIDIIFSNDRSNILIDRIEKKLKLLWFEEYPEYIGIAEINILLTYLIKGGYYAFTENENYDIDILLPIIGDIAECITKKIVDTI